MVLLFGRRAVASICAFGLAKIQFLNRVFGCICALGFVLQARRVQRLALLSWGLSL